jgi:hypothetical protein
MSDFFLISVTLLTPGIVPLICVLSLLGLPLASLIWIIASSGRTLAQILRINEDLPYNNLLAPLWCKKPHCSYSFRIMYKDIFLEVEFLGNRNKIRQVNKNYIFSLFISLFVLRRKSLFSTSSRMWGLSSLYSYVYQGLLPRS